MKRYIRSSSIRDMRIQTVMRWKYPNETKYQVGYISEDDAKVIRYTDATVPQKVLYFIENNSEVTCHSEDMNNLSGSVIYDVFWEKQ